MSSEQEKCDKCGIMFWLDKHHILPKSTFGGKGTIAKLCPNCHREYHRALGSKNLKNPDEQFHYDFFAKWIAGSLALILLVAMWFFL